MSKEPREKVGSSPTRNTLKVALRRNNLFQFSVSARVLTGLAKGVAPVLLSRCLRRQPSSLPTTRRRTCMISKAKRSLKTRTKRSYLVCFSYFARLKSRRIYACSETDENILNYLRVGVTQLHFMCDVLFLSFA
jgi:hypothetical protein